MLEISLEVVEVEKCPREKTCGCKESELQQSQGEEEELAWRRGRGACVVPSVARRNGGEAVSRQDGERGGRRRRPAAFFGAYTLIETRGSREIEAARRPRGSASLFSSNKR